MDLLIMLIKHKYSNINNCWIKDKNYKIQLIIINKD